jgi:hypothetical protein
MNLVIEEDQPQRLAEYARVPIGFLVEEVIDDEGIEALGQGGPVRPAPIRAP